MTQFIEIASEEDPFIVATPDGMSGKLGSAENFMTKHYKVSKCLQQITQQ